MNKFYLIVFVALLALGFGNKSYCQSGIITTIAGIDSAGYNGDGIQATNSKLHNPVSATFDIFGNLYVADANNNRIRKIDAFGVITTVAGNGSSGFSGDGGPATAAKLAYPTGIVFDKRGNLLIVDQGNLRIRKVDTFGIISTIGGNGIWDLGVDGIPATSSAMFYPYSIAADRYNNIYFSDSQRVRKIDTFGVVTTVAGNGSWGFSGDGGPATNAAFGVIFGIAIDNIGELLIVDNGNNRIRRVDTGGIITTIAGNGIPFFSGDGGLAIDAGISSPMDVTTDNQGIIYIADDNRVRMISTDGYIKTVAGNGLSGYSGDGGIATDAQIDTATGLKIDSFGNIFIVSAYTNTVRKVRVIPDIQADSFSVTLFNNCNRISFHVQTKSYSVGQHVITFFGNGNSFDTATSPIGAIGEAILNCKYATSGNYTIKHVLFDGTMAVDSVTYVRYVSLCQSLVFKFYNDTSGACIYDSSTVLSNVQPVLVQVDSNHIPIDTISATSGIYYTAYGSAGDVYSFKVIQTPAGMYIGCPSSDSLADTLFSGINSTKVFGLSCNSTASFDLSEFTSDRTGRHMQTVEMIVNNNHCTPEPTILTFNFSPKYVFESADPTPTSVVGHSISWNLGFVSDVNPAPFVHATLSVPGAWLIPGDTVFSECIVTPMVGDTDTTNNITIRYDTVKGSYDPNNIDVVPSGYILPGAQLKYTLNFENTGNDTARNIYVMDTLSDDVDPRSIRIIAASAIMNFSKIYDSVYHNIIKFEFPHINLPDSSHHDQCEGMVIYSIKTRTGLADGTVIRNHAGIYFDDNAPVLTDTATNVIALINGNYVACPGLHDTLTELAAGGTWTTSNANATVSGALVTGVTVGLDTITYTVTYANGPISVTKVISVNPLPHAGVITGSDTVCVAATITLTDTTSGGTWSASNNNASVISGVVTGDFVGLDTIYYVVGNVCGFDTAKSYGVIRNAPFVGTIISSSDSVCVAATLTLSDVTSGGLWNTTNAGATISTGGILTGVSAGWDTVTYSVSLLSCGTTSVWKKFYVNALAHASIISCPDSFCQGTLITLFDSSAGGTWHLSNSHGFLVDSMVSGMTPGLDTVFYYYHNYCGSDTAHKKIYIKTLPVVGAITGLDSVCIGAHISLHDASSSGHLLWSAIDTNSVINDSTGVVTGHAAGFSTIVYALTNDCGYDTAQRTIFVKALPNAGVITGNDSVCQSGSVTLHDSITGGHWYLANAHASTADSIVHGISGGYDTIFYTFTNSCGTDTVKKSIWIKSLPDAGMISISSDSFCIGASGTLSETVTGGTWSASNNNVSISGNVVTGVSYSSDTVNYTVTNNCGPSVATKAVFVKRRPNPGIISGIDSFCVGQTINLSETVSGGSWGCMNPHANVLGSVLYGMSGGIDTVLYQVANECGDSLTSFKFTVIAPEVPVITGSNRVCIGSMPDTVYGMPAGGAWYVTNANASFSSGIIVGNTAGKDTIIYTRTNFCGPRHDTFTVYVLTKAQCDSANGVNDEFWNDNIVSVFPNPNNGQFIVEVPELTGEVSIVVTDIVGKTVAQKVLTVATPGTGKTQLPFDLGSVPNGTYMFKVVSDTQTYVGKMVVER